MRCCVCEFLFFFPPGARARLAASVLSGNNVLQLAYLIQQYGFMKDGVGGAGERRTEERAGAIHHAETIFKANLSAGMIKHNCLPVSLPVPSMCC